METDKPQVGATRRVFLKQLALASATVAGAELGALAGSAAKNSDARRAAKAPWYRHVLRWGQTNITELDPTRYDIGWWREYWQRTQVQGIIVNAGGIVAYYPSRFPLHRRAQFLGERDLFGELVQAARQQGLAVLARMDSSRASEEFYRAHPDWFAVDASGRPHRSGELYTSCVNGPYFREYIPDVLREIVARYHPEGFTDNSWSGLGRNGFCYCENCTRKFRAETGQALPRASNWDDPAYRQWIQWSYKCRLDVWDLNNRITREAGGPDCIWVGMNSGSVAGQAQSFRDYKEICARAEIILLDHQARSDASGFQNNGETGKLIHGLLGWEKLIPESMALYQAGRPGFRLSAKPAAEARMWMLEGFAGGIQPWWHHVGAVQEDRRAFRTVEPINRWHQAHEEFLVNRQPVASVGVVWSQQNTDFYGRDDAESRVEQPWRGITQALIRARIPYLPVHADHLERDMANFSLLILPNFVAMTDAQIAVVRRFVEGGGGLLATGESSLANEWGEPRPDFALAELFGAHVDQKRVGLHDSARRRWASETQHTYLRLDRAVESSGGAGEAVLRGFEETDLLPFGGTLEALKVEANARVALTFVPSFPAYPPESSWMRQPRTDIPGLILNDRGNGTGRAAFLPADLDRRFARDNLPDQGDLLANLVRWCARDTFPLMVEGPGLIDCHFYRQPGRLILHLVNLTSAGTWRAPVDELIPVGPLRVRVKLPHDVRGRMTQFLVAGGKRANNIKAGWAGFEVKSVLDHEVAVIR
ncbi:MAG TPA: alpha-amylase family protein [Candidatus Binatia bacterium]|jgi:hypothetical protein|nr:alpha-amylase family protein [Candidatus Binatia bacterium]